MSLAEDVGQQGMAVAQAQGHTAGDALNAYQIMSKVQADREKLEQDKDNHEMSKSNWFATQLNNISSTPEGKVRNLLLDDLEKHGPGLIPGFNSQNVDVLRHDDDALKGMQSTFADYALNPSAESAKKLNGMWGMLPADYRSEAIKVSQARQQMLGQQARAESMAAPRIASSQLSANNQYTQTIGKTENAIYSADRGADIIDHINAGDLKSTKTLSADLEAATASLLAQGRPSTVYGQQAVHMDDAYSRIQNAKQFITANPEDTQSPAKLEQLKKDMHALRDFYGDQHAQQYESFREGLPTIFQGAIDKRYNKFRASHNLGGAAGDVVHAAGQSAAPATGPHGPSVVQNGHTYNWNPQTGKYE